jgi:hypothetical protein
LSQYTLRSRGLRASDGQANDNTALFPLPSLAVPARSYVVLSGKADANRFDGPRLVRVLNADGLMPFWYGSGFLELLKGGATIDFVRFGSNAVAPITEGAWQGGNAPALPNNASTHHAKSLMRDVALDTNSAADWRFVEFSTPGGLNDVAPGAVLRSSKQQRNAGRDGEHHDQRHPESMSSPGIRLASGQITAPGHFKSSRGYRTAYGIGVRPRSHLRDSLLARSWFASSGCFLPALLQVNQQQGNRR